MQDGRTATDELVPSVEPLLRPIDVPRNTRKQKSVSNELDTDKEIASVFCFLEKSTCKKSRKPCNNRT